MIENLPDKTVFTGEYLCFQKYKVKIAVKAENKSELNEIRKRLKKTFPNGLDAVDLAEVEYFFEIKKTAAIYNAKKYEFYLNTEKIFEDENRVNFFDFIESRLRLTVAEFASERVFLHAGVVGWNGKAIIIPAKSFSGKTTLVAELVKKGAEYFSDEYAVLDADANVEPFPKWLSMRGIIDETRQIEQPVKMFGGVAASETVAPGMILLATYCKEVGNPKNWNLKPLKQGEAVMELLPHTMSIRNNPRFVLEVLNKLTNRAIIVRTLRGEAADFAEPLLGFYESIVKN